MAPNDLEQLSALFLNIGEDVVHDVFANCSGDYQKAYTALLEMCPKESRAMTRNSALKNNDGSCRFVRFITVETRNPNEDCVQLSRIILFANGRPLEVKRVSNPNGHNPAGEAPNNIKDQHFHTKWLDFFKQPLIMELAESATPDSYILVTANDFPNRDPIRWVMDVSTNGKRWTQLDDRSHSNQSITHSRMHPTLPFGINGTCPPASLVQTIPVPMSDREQIEEWTRTSRQAPRGFQQAARSICFVPELMQTSRMDHKIALLEARQREDDDDSMASNHEAIEATVAHLVSRAFGLSSVKRAHSYTSSAPDDPWLDGNFFDGCMDVYLSLEPWQQPVFHTALQQMLSQDSDSLKIMCGLLLHASRECMARKQYAFMVTVDRSIDHHAEPIHDSDEDTLELHKRVLFDTAQTSIDELKSLAFKSIFLEPTKMYFRAVRDNVMEGDVEVHGSNTYLALLLAALGVKLAHTPMLSDSLKGIAAFRDALNISQVDKLWDPVNRGKSWETVIGRRHPTVKRHVSRNHFYFDGTTAGQLAHDCLNNRAGIERFKPYLEAFARHFSEEEAVEWLCNSLLSRDSISRSLNAVFTAVASVEEVEEAEGDARYWLWDLMLGDFRLERALSLLRFAGICREQER